MGKSNEYYGGEIFSDQKITIDRQQIFGSLEKEFNSKMFLTVYNGFIFAFCRFYSSNFDNYNIIENILIKNKKSSTKKKEKENKDKIIELSGDFDKKDALLEPNQNDNDENNILNQDEKEKEIIQDDLDDKSKGFLPKLNFYDFFFNNIYCKTRCPSNKQELINACNKIISKYYTMEYIIYNQMRLENLFKDYKWNDPKLSNFEKNKMISDLESYI